MTYTKKEIEAITTELHQALIESLEADQALAQANLAKSKAHQRLLQAKSALSDIKFN